MILHNHVIKLARLILYVTDYLITIGTEGGRIADCIENTIDARIIIGSGLSISHKRLTVESHAGSVLAMEFQEFLIEHEDCGVIEICLLVGIVCHHVLDKFLDDF